MTIVQCELYIFFGWGLIRRKRYSSKNVLENIFKKKICLTIQHSKSLKIIPNGSTKKNIRGKSRFPFHLLKEIKKYF